jgi:hypothetical protein
MAQIKIVDIAQELGICPICLAESVEEKGIDTFSSRESFDSFFKAVFMMKSAKNPVYREGGWIYYCIEHFDDSDCEEPDLEVEIED